MDSAVALRRAYQRARRSAGGDWHSYVTVGGTDVLVADDAERVLPGYSVQKLALAVAVLAAVDAGDVRLDQRIRLDAGLVLGGSGAYHLQGVWGDELTVAGVLTALLLVSDNTAVRLCGRAVPAERMNETLATLGLRHTRVVPAEAPDRFWAGTTTPRETHDLLWRLATRTLLAPGSCDLMLGILRGGSGYHDGVRRDMSSAERARVATKHGADFDEHGAARHEVGVVFAADGAPAVTYAFFADGLGQVDNYGGTHPAVRAHASLGRALLATADAHRRA